MRADPEKCEQFLDAIRTGLIIIPVDGGGWETSKKLIEISEFVDNLTTEAEARREHSQ